MQQEWIHDFFGDFYQKGWENAGSISKRDADYEVNQVLTFLEAKPSSHILDWCGGWGRHSIRFAQKGYKVTLLDFSEQYVQRAELEAEKQGVQLDTIVADFRNTPPGIQADYAVNLFTAGLGYLGKNQDLVALKSLAAALKPGALFLIDTVNLFWIARNFSETSWYGSEDGDWLLERRNFDFLNNTNASVWIYRDKAEKTEQTKTGRIRLYNCAELSELLALAGFKPLKIYGGFDGSEYGFNSKRLIVVSQK